MENGFLLVYISLIREQVLPVVGDRYGALIPQGESLLIDGVLAPQNEPVLLAGPHRIASADTPWLRFDLSRKKPQTTGAFLTTATAEIPDGPVLMRLDQVTFPTGAVAYRHVHSGAGIRYLDQGHLTLQADDHSFEAHVGDSWFEPANTPVRATADSDVAQSRFVRFMALPVDFAGKPTINILDAEDAKRPKLQTTHRFFERIVHLDAG